MSSAFLQATVITASAWPVFIACAGAQPRTDQPPCFSDQGASDETLVAFRQSLIAAIDRRDLVQLATLFSADVRVSDRLKGFNNLVETYDLHDPNVAIWRDLRNAVQHGGRFRRNRYFCAPWFTCTGDGGDAQSYVVTGRDVSAFAAPSVTSRQIASVSCENLKPAVPAVDPVTGASLPSEWVAVLLNSGEPAFIKEEHIAAQALYLIFEKRAGRWYVIEVRGTD